MTSLINGALQRRQVVFPAEHLEIEDQFTTHSYTLHDARMVYAKGNDHVIDAVRCAMLVREQANLCRVGEESVSLMTVMTDPCSCDPIRLAFQGAIRQIVTTYN